VSLKGRCKVVNRRQQSLKSDTIRFELKRTVEKLTDEYHKHLRQQVVVLTTLLKSGYRRDFKIQLPERKREIFALAFLLSARKDPKDLHWILTLIREEIRRKSNRYDSNTRALLLSLLEGTNLTSIEIVLDNQTFGKNPSELFGNLLALSVSKLTKIICFDPQKYKKPRRAIRKRGYDDHGHLVLDDHGRKEYNGSLEQRTEMERLEKKKRYEELRAFYYILDTQDDF